MRITKPLIEAMLKVERLKGYLQGMHHVYIGVQEEAIPRDRDRARRYVEEALAEVAAITEARTTKLTR